MHTVIASECTGCGLCIEPCPIDCIETRPVDALTFDKDKARLRFNAKKIRALQEAQQKEAHYQEKRFIRDSTVEAKADKDYKKDYIAKALLRVKAKKHE